tara:strand:+ start:529 stop:1239 length:711 start_codon:yes stop_codon:yes gene_type:complete
MSKSNKNCVDGPSQRLLQDGLFRTTITGRGAVGKDRTQRLIQVINKIPLFSGLGPTQVQAVLGACSPQRFEAGDVMCAAGTPGEELFILLSGQASVFYAADDTEIAQITPVSTIGEMSIATKQIRTSTVKATQVSNVLVIKRMALDVALKADTEAQAKILRNVVEILAMRMERDAARRQEELLEKLQHRADLALGILARRSGMPLFVLCSKRNWTPRIRSGGSLASTMKTTCAKCC